MDALLVVKGLNNIPAILLKLKFLFLTAGWSDNLMFMKTQLQIKKAAKGAASATVVSLLWF